MPSISPRGQGCGLIRSRIGNCDLSAGFVCGAEIVGCGEWPLCAVNRHSRDCDGAPRFQPLPTFAPEFYTVQAHRTLELQPAVRIPELRKNTFAGL
jgi:hypothetical protein